VQDATSSHTPYPVPSTTSLKTYLTYAYPTTQGLYAEDCNKSISISFSATVVTD
jgi:hypothetical protein